MSAVATRAWLRAEEQAEEMCAGMGALDDTVRDCNLTSLTTQRTCGVCVGCRRDVTVAQRAASRGLGLKSKKETCSRRRHAVVETVSLASYRVSHCL